MSNYNNQVVNQFIIGEIEAEVNRRIDAGESFTAFDISRAIQATGIRERHRNLKGVVHEMYERGDMPGYIRTLVTLPSGEQPYLYHPDNRMIQNRFAVASNSSAVTQNTAVMFGQGQRPTPTITGHLDSDNRLRLPVSILRKAGFLPGDTIYIARDSGTGNLTISARPANAPDIRPTRAHRLSGSNLRLTLGAVFSRLTVHFEMVVAAPGRIEVKPQ